MNYRVGLICMVVWICVEARLVLPGWGVKRTLEQKKLRAVEFIQEQLELSNIPALTIVHGDKVLLNQGFGLKQYGNASSKVTENSMFQIGSVTKTMLTLGIGKLVDNQTLNWHDRVKQHLPWFELQDKYAENFTTIHDLLTMNTVFAEGDTEVAWLLGLVRTEQEAVRKLGKMPTQRSLRQGYEYSNINFGILGAIIEEVTKQSWGTYLENEIFKPLGMQHTFSSARTASLVYPDDLTEGHFTCNNKVAGPYSLVTSPMTKLCALDSEVAAGSMVSSIHDMAIFARLLLNKGVVDGISLFKTPGIIDSMITGQIINTMFIELGLSWGYQFTPDGNSFAAGYGIDAVGYIMYNSRYYDKNGDTSSCATRTGFLPDHDLGIVLLSNARSFDIGSNTLRLSHIRTYLLGLFLDIPDIELDATFHASALAADKQNPLVLCDPHFFGNETRTDKYKPTFQQMHEFQGIYESTVSKEFYGSINVTIQNEFLYLRYGVYEGRLYGINNQTFEWAVTFAQPITWTLSFEYQNGLVYGMNWNGLSFSKSS
uniref:Secreted protein n=1 Tax=Thraustotheca clavata TaxID=74557 RepID=A0A0A7CLY6_9STRA|nr:secreted protein [Thraustotheca clavata]